MKNLFWGEFSMDCCLQLASHNCFLYISLVDSCFFTILRIYRLNFTSQQYPFESQIPYPGHQRFFSRAAGISGVGRRPTRLRYKYPFALRWEKRTFHCEKHISDKTSITNDIPQSCIFLLFISYVYYTCCHWHFYSLLFIFILVCNFYGHGLVTVLSQWGLRFRNIHLRAKRNLRIAVQTFILEQMALFSVSIRRISASFWSKRIL